MKIDELESVFKSASKLRFHPENVSLKEVLLVTDLEGEAALEYEKRLREFLDPLPDEFSLKIFEAKPETFLNDLLKEIENASPDLICTFRNLNSDAWKFGYSLGEHLELLTQSTKAPVLVLPNPKSEEEWAHLMQRPSAIMVVTDHLTGDDHLVSYGLAFTPDEGTLFLSHVEDQVWFDRFLDYVGKIPEIDTDLAKEKLSAQILKEPEDYVQTVKDVLQTEALSKSVESKVTVGAELVVYRRWLKEHEINLVVLNTKDEHQAAMSGFAHAFAVEFRHVPTLML